MVFGELFGCSGAFGKKTKSGPSSHFPTSKSSHKEMLISNNIKEKIIPYKENRAVIFNSKLFHSTDDFKFDNSYANRRVNITFLYD